MQIHKISSVRIFEESWTYRIMLVCNHIKVYWQRQKVCEVAYFSQKRAYKQVLLYTFNFKILQNRQAVRPLPTHRNTKERTIPNRCAKHKRAIPQRYGAALILYGKTQY